MENIALIHDRTPVWIALSIFYLDTELEKDELEPIARIFKQSRYTIAEIKLIDRYEVWPVLNSNLASVAGVWAAFNEEWLISECSKYINGERRGFFLTSKIYKWSVGRYWKKIDLIYKNII